MTRRNARGCAPILRPFSVISAWLRLLRRQCGVSGGRNGRAENSDARCVKRPPTRAAPFFIAATFLLARGGRDTMARIPADRPPASPDSPVCPRARSPFTCARIYAASANHISVGDATACRVTRFPVLQASSGAYRAAISVAGPNAPCFCGSPDLARSPPPTYFVNSERATC